MNYTTANSHLGDCAWLMIALRRIPGPHTVFCPTEYHPQLQDFCENRRIELQPLESAPADARNTWIGCGRFESKGVKWAGQQDIVGFLMQWSNCLCEENGIQPQFLNRTDFLADCPQIARETDVPEFDALVINAQPRSGQIPRYDNAEMDALIERIATRHRVICTNPTTAVGANAVNKTMCEIGNLALRAQFIVANATGPSWGIHSVWSQNVRTYMLLDPLFIDYGRVLPHHGLVKDGVEQQLIQDGWL